MPYGLKKHIIEQIVNVFYGYPAVEKVLLYGSRAKGTYKPASDIDLTLVGKDLNLKTLNRISLQLDDLLLPYFFDLSLYHHIKDEDMLDHISRVGKVFYDREVVLKEQQEAVAEQKEQRPST